MSYELKQRPGNIPCRLRQAGKKRWIPGHAVWVSDVLAFDGSPAVWNESLTWIREISPLGLDQDEARKLKRLGPAVVAVTLTTDKGEELAVAAKASFSPALTGRLLPLRPLAWEPKPSSTVEAID